MTRDISPLLVLDLDGTIADTAADLIGTLNFIMAREGLAAVSLASGRAMVGAGARALLERGYAASGQSVEADELDALFHEFLAIYESRIAQETRLFPGFESALDRFAAAGWRFAVCTNKIEGPSVKLLTALGVAHRFEAICGQDTFRIEGEAISKPDPRALTLTIAQAGGAPSDAVMVGDSRTDILTAQNAGVPVVAVDFGYTDVHVSELGPDRVISHFDELWDAVESLRNAG
ncbi:MAG: HAD-superfamily hydrolase, subfamily variant 1 [Hyphomicrobiales bacterium]|nr:HAD-superfamily hydrolase, subfamily variant 1 [Hyphomicrobiales bacterium]